MLCSNQETLGNTKKLVLCRSKTIFLLLKEFWNLIFGFKFLPEYLFRDDFYMEKSKKKEQAELI